MTHHAGMEPRDPNSPTDLAAAPAVPAEGGSDEGGSAEGGSAVSGWRQRLGALVDRIRRLPGVATVLAVNDGYGAAGGGLLAAGLSFGALFALIPGLLLVVSVLIVLVDDASTRQRVVDWLVSQVPPLSDIASTVVDNLASGARVGSVVGLVLFLWGAGGFYLSLRNALVRLIPGGKQESVVRARLESLLAMALLVAGALLAFVLAGIASVVPLGPWAPILSPIGAVAVAWLLCLVLYVTLPNDRPTVREAMPAALAAGIGIGLLTAFFGALAPFLVQGFAGLGVIASVFVALVWFNWTFQLLLLGASFARTRRDSGRVARP